MLRALKIFSCLSRNLLATALFCTLIAGLLYSENSVPVDYLAQISHGCIESTEFFGFSTPRTTASTQIMYAKRKACMDAYSSLALAAKKYVACVNKTPLAETNTKQKVIRLSINPRNKRVIKNSDGYKCIYSLSTEDFRGLLEH